MSFVLLKLPFLAMENVAQFMNFDELIGFSLTSVRIQKIIKQFKKLVLSKRKLGVKFAGYPDSCVTLQFPIKENVTNFVQQWEFCEEQLPDSNVRETVLLGRILKTYKPERLDVIRTVWHTNDLFFIATVLKFLTETFECSYHFVILKARDFHIPPIQAFTDAIKTCDQLIIHGTSEGYTIEQMTYFLNFIKPSKRFDICATPDRNFRPRNFKYIGLDRVEISPSEWISQADFFSMTYEHIKLVNSVFGSEVFLEFIKRWMASNNTRFKTVEIYTKEKFKPIDLSAMNPTPFVPSPSRQEIRENQYHLDYYFIEDGVNIVREDGLEATVYYKDEFFSFCVWPHTQDTTK